MAEVVRDVAHASVLVDLERYDEAASVLVQILAVEPADDQAWCLLAAAHLGAGRYRAAVAAASSAITLAPTDDRPYRLASIAHRHLGNIGAAVAAANEACKLAPHEWRAYACLARAQLATEVDFMAAGQAAASALRLAPSEPDAHFTAGQVSYAQERWKAARAHQERALSLDPTHSGALNELGRIRLHRGGLSRAAGHFLQAARSEPAVNAYARNAEVPIRRVMGLIVQAACYGSSVFLVLIIAFGASRALGIGYAAAIALIAAFTAVQLWRMPPGMRPLLRTRRVALALGVVYGAILVAIITAAVTPARVLFGAMLAATALIAVSAVAAGLSLRRKSILAGKNVT